MLDLLFVFFVTAFIASNVTAVTVAFIAFLLQLMLCHCFCLLLLLSSPFSRPYQLDIKHAAGRTSGPKTLRPVYRLG